MSVVWAQVVAGMPVVHAMSEVQTDANDRPQRPVCVCVRARELVPLCVIVQLG